MRDGNDDLDGGRRFARYLFERTRLVSIFILTFSEESKQSDGAVKCSLDRCG
jgi:hypothetical protein